MEDEAIVDEILAAVKQLMQVAGPEGALEFIQGGIDELQGGGGEEVPAEEGGPPPMPGGPAPGGMRPPPMPSFKR